MARTRSIPTFALLLAALAASSLAALAFSASAAASVTGYQEPKYTKTSGNNAFWYSWTAVDGVDSSGNTNYTYYLCFNTFRNGIREESSNGTNGPGSTNCTTSLRSGPTPSSGNNGFYPYGGTSTTLQNGHTYQLCASDWWAYVFVWHSGISTCPTTTVDRDRPTLGVSLGNGAEVTNNPIIPVSISYSDPVSPPWAGSNGYASNWVCITAGTSCTPGGNPNNHCSAPNGGFNNRINSFSCSMNISAADGRYAFCTFGADQAIPDNPGGTDQFVGATSNNANLSTTACDSIVLDRAGPSVSVTPSATNVTVGQLVTFSMSASDPNGLSGGVTWDFGDNTPQANGASATHTYTQPGTYVAKARQSDAAGNPGEGTATITVSPAPTGGGGDGGDGGGTDDGGGDTVTPGTGAGTSGATPLTGGMTGGQIAEQIGSQSGGGGATTTSVGSLDVVAPKRFRSGKRRMLLAFTAATGGSLKVALLRRSKVISRKSASLGGPGTYTVKLRLPRKLRAGTHKLKVTFRPAGETRATTRTLKIKVAARKKRKRAGRQVVDARGLGGTPATRSRKPVAVDPRSVDRTVEVR